MKNPIYILDILIQDNHLIISNFVSYSLLEKFKLTIEELEDWKILVDSIYIDWNYDTQVFRPTLYEFKTKKELISGKYELPENYSKICVKVVDISLKDFWKVL